MSKSIIIFGKGPSVLKCTRDIVDQYDDIAICNYPVLNDFFLNLIKNRHINYHFANCGSVDKRYTNKVNKLLNIKKVLNTNKGVNNYNKYLINLDILKENIHLTSIKYFKEKYNLNPSGGTMAIKYILDTKLYNKICLVGYDNFQIGKPVYYFKPNEYNSALKHLFINDTFTKEGNMNICSGHDPKKTFKYYTDVIENNPDIQFIFITDIQFNKFYNNLTIK